MMTHPPRPRSDRLVIHTAAAFTLFVLAGWPLRSAHAQQGLVDPTFAAASGLTGNVASLGLLGNVSGLVLQPDGNLLVVGGLNGLSRLNADGTTDTTFHPGAVTPTSTILVQGNGKILVFDPYPEMVDTSSSLVRLNADGTVDTSFDGQAAAAPSYGGFIALQSSGKILVGDLNQSAPGAVGTGLSRLNMDGSVDASFDMYTGYIQQVVVQGDDKILVLSDVDASGNIGVVRLDADGTPDATYNYQEDGNDIAALDLQADGKVLVTNYSFDSETPGDSYLIRLDIDGSLDTTFNYSGTTIPTVLAVDAGNKVYFTRDANFNLKRLNARGSLDASFNVTADNKVGSVVPLADGTLLLGGTFTEINGIACNSVARINADGSVVTSYTVDIAPGPNAPVAAIALQSDGGVVIGGAFTQVDGAPHSYLARLQSDGTTDTAFGPSLDGPVSAVVVQGDGKIVFCGSFTQVNGTAAPGYARVNTDGSLDTTFDISPLAGFVDLLAQPSGMILLGGTLSGGASAYERLNADGSVESSFSTTPETGFPYAVQPDGKILAGTANQLFRLNTDGSRDPTFTNGFYVGLVSGFIGGVAVQADGKILVAAGYFGYGNPPFTELGRINADGSLDSSFTAETDHAVNAILPEPFGTVVIGGSFTQADGAARQGLAHLSADGSLNPLAGLETGTNGRVAALVLQPDGKVLVGGKFTSVDGTTRNYVARLTSGGTPDFFSGGTAVGGGFYYLQFPDGNPFGYYNLAGDGYSFPYLFHDDLGLEYFFDANDGNGGAYLYDFASSTFFYTSPTFPFPYLYDFSLNSVLYYYPAAGNPGHYNTNGVRYFYDFNKGAIITK